MRSHLAVALAAALVPAATASAAPALLPFPNDRLTVADTSTDTGRRLHLVPAQMPKNGSGTPVDATDINRFDGFSPGSQILIKVPGLDTPAALAKTRAVPLSDLARYADKNAPVVVIDAKSHKRWPIWVELDANATSAKDVLVLIHPAKNFLEGHRYIVALRNLRNAAGKKLAPAAKVKGKALLADLHKAKIEPQGLYASWSFTVASADSLAGRMLAIRNDAFAQLGDRNLADLKVSGRAPAFNVTSVVDFTEAENAKLARRVIGTFQVPCYLDQAGCPPGSKFNLDPATGLPAQMPGNEQTASFRCNIPRSATAAAPARLSLYGHGLLGSNDEIDAGNVQDMSFEHDMVFCATNWVGMAEEDVPNAISVLKDASNMPTVADRLQQGILATLYLGRLMIHPSGLPANAAFAGIVDPSHLYYDGNSQGGIMGGATTPFAPDYTRAVLGVPGMNYSVLLLRSKDWTTFSGIFNPAYPNERERPLVMDLLQLMWDRGEADGYAQHMTSKPYANTPAHTVLLQPAVGDFQVTTFQAEVEARTIGAFARRPAAASGRLPEKTQLWGIPTIKTFPFGGSAIVMWDSGPGHNGAAPLTNMPSSVGEDPHENPRATPAARQQKSDFLMPDGKVTEVCGTTPCHSAAYTP
ncbi:MAG: hypothetical protein QOG68_1884 [Solirubrobacteraceae bacterium]|nr:hypothetical protein [Solirubrobacteraceae bacterium]